MLTKITDVPHLRSNNWSERYGS
eukprot:SAG31_NODE_45578_length_258_cov_0.654088_1_plen_22_part_10